MYIVRSYMYVHIMYIFSISYTTFENHVVVTLNMLLLRCCINAFTNSADPLDEAKIKLCEKFEAVQRAQGGDKQAQSKSQNHSLSFPRGQNRIEKGLG